MNDRTGRRAGSLIVVVLALIFAPGCMFRDLKHNLQTWDDYGYIHGRVGADPATSSHLVVIVYTGAAGAEKVVDSFILVRPGAYYFILPAGAYRLAVFEDNGDDFVYERGRDRTALYRAGAMIEIARGEVLENIDLALTGSTAPLPFTPALPPGGVQGVRDMPTINLGAVTDFDDPRFAAANGAMGLWQPVDFLFQVGAGMYFSEDYDPDKIPVVFVHGALGTPADWRFLAENLDRSRFQPWLFYYPTAMDLWTVAAALGRWVQRLQVSYKVEEFVLVAHSMGGLVAREYINQAVASDGDPPDGLSLFVTLSTPWKGHVAAQRGVDRAPVVAPSWVDMAPGSDFLQALFTTSLPKSLPWYLLFSYGGGSRLTADANDGAVTLASQLAPMAQMEAEKVYGFDAGHGSILRSPEVGTLLNRLLDRVAE